MTKLFAHVLIEVKFTFLPAIVRYNQFWFSTVKPTIQRERPKKKQIRFSSVEKRASIYTKVNRISKVVKEMKILAFFEDENKIS